MKLRAFIKSTGSMVVPRLASAKNGVSLQTSKNMHTIKILKLPDDVLQKLKVLLKEVVSELGHSSPAAKKIFDSYEKFYAQVRTWDKISEKIYYGVR